MMLSGIGPAAELEAHGIEVAHALDGVGRNFQDHASIHLTFAAAREFEVDWTLPRLRLMARSSANLDHGDFSVTLRPPTKIQDVGSLLPLSAQLLEQAVPGQIRLNSADPRDSPAVETGLLVHPADVEKMVGAMEFIRDLTRTAPMREFYGELRNPGPDEDWATFARSTYDSYQHASGTCRMGPAGRPRRGGGPTAAGPWPGQPVGGRCLGDARGGTRQYQLHGVRDRGTAGGVFEQRGVTGNKEGTAGSGSLGRPHPAFGHPLPEGEGRI